MVPAAHAGGYQLTRDGKTRIWNNHPDRGDEATWSGNRDENGYAMGPGTLTWYRATRKIVTGSNIPSVKGPANFLSRLNGKMAGGKFEGSVEMVNAGGRTYHTVFSDGNSNDDWEIGPAPAPTKKSKVTVAKVRAESSAPLVEPSPMKTFAAAAAAVAKSPDPTPESPSASMGLFKPPSSLRVEPSAEVTPPPSVSQVANPPPVAPATPPPVAMPSKTDDESVRDLVRTFSEAWGNHDGHEMDKIMADDVDFMAADATHLHGRAELEKYHARQPNEHFKDPRSTGTDAKIRFLKPDLAQVTWNWSMRGELNPDGTVRPRRSGFMSVTAEKRNGAWLIVAAQNANAGLSAPEVPEKK